MPTQWSHIVIHHAAMHDDEDEADTGAIREYHMGVRAYKDVGYHFLVERLPRHGEAYSTEVIVGRPMTQAGAHALLWNTRALGVCFVGDYTNTAPDAAALAIAASRILKPLMTIFSIPAKNVIAHRDVGTTECPGDMFSMEALRALL